MCMEMGLVLGGPIEYDVVGFDVSGRSRCKGDNPCSESVHVLREPLDVFEVV